MLGAAVKNSVLVAVSTILAVFSPLVANARSLYDDALEHYTNKRYQQAAQGFTRASIEDPSKQIYRYYLANCLVHLDKHDRAIEEYRAAYLLNPYSSIAEYSAQALAGYHKSVPSIPGKLPEDNDLGKAKTAIRMQTKTEKYKQGLLASRGEYELKSKLSEQIKAIDDQARADIQKLYDPLIFTPGPRANPLLAMPELLKEREDAIKSSAKLEKERLLKEAEERSKPLQSWQKGREAVLDEVAANLESQLDSPVGPSGMKLQAKGTDLYVRYYGKALPNRLPEAHSATARIVPEARDYEIPTPAPTKTIDSTVGNKDVKARVLK